MGIIKGEGSRGEEGHQRGEESKFGAGSPPLWWQLLSAPGLQQLGVSLPLQQFILGTTENFERGQPWSLWIRCPQATLEVCVPS